MHTPRLPGRGQRSARWVREQRSLTRGSRLRRRSRRERLKASGAERRPHNTGRMTPFE
jgi:hypothetical protein